MGDSRLKKVICPDCGYTIRTTAKWIKVGLPTCCCGALMVPDGTTGSIQVRPIKEDDRMTEADPVAAAEINGDEFITIGTHEWEPLIKAGDGSSECFGQFFSEYAFECGMCPQAEDCSELLRKREAKESVARRR
jgi:hypothetical protein